MVEKEIKEIGYLDSPKSFIMWKDPSNDRWVKEEITKKYYQSLSSNTPDKPSGFTGSNDEWISLWTSGKAKAIDGRNIGDTQFGDVIYKDGRAIIFLGDMDNEGSLRVPKEDYIKVNNKITVSTKIPVKGITVKNGILKKV